MKIMQYTFEVTAKLTLHGYDDSTTQKFAQTYGIRFDSLGEYIDPYIYVRLQKMNTPSLKSADKGTITVKWDKASDISGYQIQYGTKKTFKNSKTKKVNSNTSRLTLKNLKKKTTYYVRIRPYITSNGKTYYAPWSNIKSVKTK